MCLQATILHSKATRDAVVQEHPTRVHQGESALKVRGQQAFAHMLEHAHADQGIKGARWLDLTIVLEQHSRVVLHARRRDTPVGLLHLRLTEGDAGCLHAIVLCGIEHQASPAAAHIQQALPRLQP